MNSAPPIAKSAPETKRLDIPQELPAIVAQLSRMHHEIAQNQHPDGIGADGYRPQRLFRTEDLRESQKGRRENCGL